jgi:hypothetical protein
MPQSLKKGGLAKNEPAPLELQARNVRSLKALGAISDFEFNRLAFVQRLVSFRNDRGKMDENVLAGLALDEPKTLTRIEPLNCSLFFQLCISFLLSYLVPYHSLQRKQKKAASVDLQPLNEI